VDRIPFKLSVHFVPVAPAGACGLIRSCLKAQSPEDTASDGKTLISRQEPLDGSAPKSRWTTTPVTESRNGLRRLQVEGRSGSTPDPRTLSRTRAERRQ